MLNRLSHTGAPNLPLFLINTSISYFITEGTTENIIVRTFMNISTSKMWKTIIKLKVTYNLWHLCVHNSNVVLLKSYKIFLFRLWWNYLFLVETLISLTIFFVVLSQFWVAWSVQGIWDISHLAVCQGEGVAVNPHFALNLAHAHHRNSGTLAASTLCSAIFKAWPISCDLKLCCPTRQP